jgi:hypothetical protein
MKIFLEILEVVVVAIIIWLVFGGLYIILQKQEKIECEKWIRESNVYPDYYFVDWQKEQCEHYGYDVSKIPVLEKK